MMRLEKAARKKKMDELKEAKQISPPRRTFDPTPC